MMHGLAYKYSKQICLVNIPIRSLFKYKHNKFDLKLSLKNGLITKLRRKNRHPYTLYDINEQVLFIEGTINNKTAPFTVQCFKARVLF